MRVTPTAQPKHLPNAHSASSSARIDYTKSRTESSMQLEIMGADPRVVARLNLADTDACSDIVAFLRNLWSIDPINSTAHILFSGKPFYTEGDPDKTDQPKTIQELSDAVTKAKKRFFDGFRVVFMPPTIDQRANSSTTYLDPSGAPVNAGAKAVSAVGYKVSTAERTLETVFQSQHGQVTRLYVSGAEKLHEIVDALKAEWGVNASTQADITLNGVRVVSDIALFRQRVQDAQAQHRKLDVYFADNTAGLCSLVFAAPQVAGTIALGLVEAE